MWGLWERRGPYPWSRGNAETVGLTPGTNFKSPDVVRAELREELRITPIYKTGEVTVHKTEEVILEPGNFLRLHMKTGISQEELEMRYMGADENGEEVVFTIATTVYTDRRPQTKPRPRLGD